jgi:uncharacterized protein
VTVRSDGILPKWIAAPIIAAAIVFPVAVQGQMRETEIFIDGPTGILRGTLATGAPNGPVILIIPGSGPTDRDGNNAGGVRAQPYRMLAHALADKGVASLRIDKRGTFGSAGASLDLTTLTIADYAADVQAWITRLRRDGAPCVWLLGHSEGGLVALETGQKAAGLCGLVLASTPGRPLGTILRQQIAGNPANKPIQDDAFRMIAELEAGRRVDVAGAHAALGQLFSPVNQNFLISTFRIDPAALVASRSGPVLIIQGEADLQTLPEDADKLAAAQPLARRVLLPRMNHVWKDAPADDRAANLLTYGNPSLPLSAGLADEIARFVKPGR